MTETNMTRKRKLFFRSILSIVIVFLSFFSRAQSIDSLEYEDYLATKHTDNDSAFLELLITDDTELYVKPREEFFQYIKKNLNYPDSSYKAKVEGKVFVEFSINVDGSVSDIKILRGLTTDINKEVIRLLSSMPKWEWEKDFKDKKKVKFCYPIIFEIEDNK